MAMFAGAGWIWNTSDMPSDLEPRVNESGLPEGPGRNYIALLYSILILAIVFGNTLVCLAVLRERALQTSTNYLVVSLAVADLLVATLVMPWVVYLEVVGGDWLFSRIYCNIFVTLDVMMCTASILNLCAISIDRYTAVVMPVLYNSPQTSRRRVSIMIATVWVLAFAVSCPLLFGFNTTDNPTICSISNPQFVIYSSVVSFYLPFVVTLLVYVRIYMFLKKRRKRITFRQASRKVESDSPTFAETCLQEDTAKDRKDLSPNQIKMQEEALRPQASPGPCLLSTCLPRWKSKTAPSSTRQPVVSPDSGSISQASFTRTENEPRPKEEREKKKEPGEQATAGHGKPEAKRRCEVKNLTNGQTRVSLRATPLTSRRQMTLRSNNMQAREKKATQMLAIVLGIFLICWLPFFVIHVLKTHCPHCYIPDELYGAATWLGYVNSAVNPVIYTTFNIEFRRAFVKILTC